MVIAALVALAMVIGGVVAINKALGRQPGQVSPQQVQQSQAATPTTPTPQQAGTSPTAFATLVGPDVVPGSEELPQSPRPGGAGSGSTSGSGSQRPSASTPTAHPSTTASTKPATMRTILDGEQREITTAFVSASSHYSHTPAGPKQLAYPVLHTVSGGTGTYANPITAAVGVSTASGTPVLDYPAGTRLYIPTLRRYFLVEDVCSTTTPPQDGPCHALKTAGNAAPPGATTWIQVWIDGQSGTAEQVKECATSLSAGLTTVVVNPKPSLPVQLGGAVFHDGVCDLTRKT